MHEKMRSFGSFWTLAYKNGYKGQEKRANKVAEGGVAGALPNWAKYLPFKGALEDSSKFIYGQFFSSIEERMSRTLASKKAPAMWSCSCRRSSTPWPWNGNLSDSSWIFPGPAEDQCQIPTLKVGL